MDFPPDSAMPPERSGRLGIARYPRGPTAVRPPRMRSKSTPRGGLRAPAMDASGGRRRISRPTDTARSSRPSTLRYQVAPGGSSRRHPVNFSEGPASSCRQTRPSPQGRTSAGRRHFIPARAGGSTYPSMEQDIGAGNHVKLGDAKPPSSDPWARPCPFRRRCERLFWDRIDTETGGGYDAVLGCKWPLADRERNDSPYYTGCFRFAKTETCLRRNSAIPGRKSR